MSEHSKANPAETLAPADIRIPGFSRFYYIPSLQLERKKKDAAGQIAFVYSECVEVCACVRMWQC